MSAGDATPARLPLTAKRGNRCALGPVGLAIYNTLYWPYLLLSCVVLFVPACAIFLLTFWWDTRRKLLQRYTALWGSHYLTLAPFAGVSVQGRERVANLRACVYVCNHQSMVDILAAFATRLPYLWVSKRENFFVPFLGWNMWLNGYVSLKRGYLPSIVRMVRTCMKKLAAGNSLFVFPEGTRSPDGELQRFHRGAFWVAAKNQVPVVPIVIEGTAQVLPKRQLRIMPQPVVIRVLDPVDPALTDYNDRALRDLVHTRMADEIASLRRDGAVASHG